MCLRISSFFGSMESTRGLYNLHFCLHCHSLFNPSSIISMTSFSKDTSIPTLENIFFYALDVKTKKSSFVWTVLRKLFLKYKVLKVGYNCTFSYIININASNEVNLNIYNMVRCINIAWWCISEVYSPAHFVIYFWT